MSRLLDVNARNRANTDRTHQRRFVSIKPKEQPRSVNLAEDHPALVEGRTLMPNRVFHASLVDRVLKSGRWSRKTGKLVTKGRWRGFPIFTLTLEERATCPRSCAQWRTCYGRNMPFAERIIHDGVFEARLWSELEALDRLHPDGFVVRLHILGDFYSIEYVAIWEAALSIFPALRVFGYTARSPFEPIGRELFVLTNRLPDRFSIRFSNGGFATGCAEVVDRAEDTSNIICPAQTGKTDCCATCALCWQSPKTIAFLRH